MNVNDIAEEIVDLVQIGLADKINTTKIKRGVVNVLNKFIRKLAEAAAEEEYVVIVNMDSGVPTSVATNSSSLNGALFVCIDNISTVDDEDNAVIVYDDNVIVGTGEIIICDDTDMYVHAANKYDKLK